MFKADPARETTTNAKLLVRNELLSSVHVIQALLVSHHGRCLIVLGPGLLLNLPFLEFDLAENASFDATPVQQCIQVARLLKVLLVTISA